MKNIYYGWWVVAGSFMILFCAAGVYFYCFPVFFDAILRDTGWLRTEVAAALSISMFVSGAAAPFIGMLVNRLGVRPVMVGGSVLFGIGFYLLSTVSAPWHLYLYYGVIASIGVSGIQLVPNFTIIGSWFTRKRSTALGIATVGIGLGGAVMAPLASWLISIFGWHNAFLFLAVIVALVGVVVSMTIMRTPAEKNIVPPESQGETAAPKNTAKVEGFTFRQALRTRAFWLVSIGVCLWGWGYSAGLIHQVAFAVDIGIDRVAAAGAIGLVTTVSIAGRLGFGRLGDSIDKRYVFMTGCALQAVAFIVLSNTAGIPMLYIYSILLGLSVGSMTPIIPGIIADHFGSRNFSTIYGACFFMLTFGHVIGPIYAGRIFDSTGSYLSAFVTSIGLSLVAVVAVYLVGKPPKRTAVGASKPEE